MNDDVITAILSAFLAVLIAAIVRRLGKNSEK